jgi:hypothetical protein
MVSLAPSDRDPQQNPFAPRRRDLPAPEPTPAGSDAETRRVIDLLRRALDRLPE